MLDLLSWAAGIGCFLAGCAMLAAERGWHALLCFLLAAVNLSFVL